MKKTLTILLIISFSIAGYTNTSAQEIFYPEIEPLLSENQKMELEKAVNILLKARGNENNANDIERKFAKLKRKGRTEAWMTKTWEAKEQRIMAEKNYTTAYQAISAVYSELIATGKYESSRIKSEALDLDIDSKSKFDAAESQLSQFADITKETLEQTPNEQVESELNESHTLKLNALALQIDALEKIVGIGQKGKSVSEDDLAWEKAKSENTLTAYYEYLDNNPRGKHMSDANKLIASFEKKSDDNLLSDDKRNPKSEPGKTNSDHTKNQNQLKGNYVFKVQIAAAISEISDWMMKAKAPGVKNIESMKSGIWIKYMVGNFSTYHEAAGYRNEIRSHVPDAFIVVFSSGKQIQVTEEMKK